jgi:F-type H+-transporting ATPase subunit gamma
MLPSPSTRSASPTKADALKTRIASVKSTQKITRAMKLVAAAKMKRATDAALASRAYSNEVTAVLRSLMARVDASDHALLTAHDDVKQVAVIIVTADRGLCGGFNNNLMRRVENWVWEQSKSQEAFADVELQSFGKKAQSYFSSRSFRFGRSVTDLNATDVIDRLSLEYNRARQAAITTELVEIVAGAEAL